MKMNTRHRIHSDGVMQARLFSLMLAFFFIVDPASAAEPVTADETDLIQINIEGTRPELTVGTGLGILAEVTNLSKKNAIYLSEKDLTLTPAPELISATGELVNWWAYFPDMESKNYYKADWMEEGRYYSIAELKPGEKITAFWWTAASSATAPTRIRRSGIGQAIGELFHASAPQSVILLGAAVGGLFAYFIHPQARRRLIDSAPSRGRSFLYEAIRRILQEIGGAFAALLLSTIATILLSRISETQFFIRVTVSDLWGAITIGFVANYAGSTILAEILKKVSASASDVYPCRLSIHLIASRSVTFPR